MADESSYFVTLTTGTVHHVLCSTKRAEMVAPWRPENRTVGDRACVLCLPDGLPGSNAEVWT